VQGAAKLLALLLIVAGIVTFGRLESGALTRRQAPYDAACGTPCC